MKLLAIFTVWFCVGLLITGAVSQLMRTLAMRMPSQDALLAAQIQLGAQRAFAPVKAAEVVWTSR
jgi:hypothetical protein